MKDSSPLTVRVPKTNGASTAAATSSIFALAVCDLSGSMSEAFSGQTKRSISPARSESKTSSVASMWFCKMVPLSTFENSPALALPCTAAITFSPASWVVRPKGVITGISIVARAVATNARLGNLRSEKCFTNSASNAPSSAITKLNRDSPPHQTQLAKMLSAWVIASFDQGKPP